MFFLALFLCSLVIWFTPWWGLAVLGFVSGVVFKKPRTVIWSAAAALSTGALAYLQDGQSHGLISLRLAGLFQLPSSVLVFLAMALLSFVTMLLTSEVGSQLRRVRRG